MIHELELTPLIPWSKSAKLLGCCARTLDLRGKKDARFQPTVVGARKYLRSTQIEAIQKGITEQHLIDIKTCNIIPTPKPSILDRIGALELEANDSQ